MKDSRGGGRIDGFKNETTRVREKEREEEDESISKINQIKSITMQCCKLGG